MPQYDFECQACQKAFEVEASLTEYVAAQKRKSIVCPECGSKKVMRVISPPTVLTPSSARKGNRPCCPGGECK